MTRASALLWPWKAEKMIPDLEEYFANLARMLHDKPAAARRRYLNDQLSQWDGRRKRLESLRAGAPNPFNPTLTILDCAAACNELRMMILRTYSLESMRALDGVH